MECLNYYNMIVGSLEQGYNIDNKLADHPRHSRMFRTGVNTRVYFNNIFKWVLNDREFTGIRLNNINRATGVRNIISIENREERKVIEKRALKLVSRPCSGTGPNIWQN